MNKMYLKGTVLSLILSSSISYAQNKQDIEMIKRATNVSALQKMSKEFFKESKKAKENAIKVAKAKGWKIKGVDKDGSRFELMKLASDGSPIYYSTNNKGASKSTRANTLNSGGLLGLDINGEDMTAYVWDGGSPRLSHKEYRDGKWGPSRVSVEDGTSELDSHSGHVMGTILARGRRFLAKGMAPKAKGKAYDWNQDHSEIANAASQGMLLSNHSYGLSTNDTPVNYFGAYISDCSRLDKIMYNAPYYLLVASAGNEGGNDFFNTNPLDGQSSYDKLAWHSVAKNSLSVANFKGAYISYGNLISASRVSSSSEGPTDDYRIKPDISANGDNIFSTVTRSNIAYGRKTGTSMSAPNATGTLLLLQQHYKSVNNNFMKAATLKGLALHTADDLDVNGPDATSGWGYLNAKFAAETISQSGQKSEIKELSLSNGSSYTVVVNAIPNQDLKVSISWTDPEGESNYDMNSHTPVLVNDLDLVVSKSGQQYKPWKLTGVTTNGKGDNNVDPFERVDISNANGQYTIKVTHEGFLRGQVQDYSLIITGGTIHNGDPVYVAPPSSQPTPTPVPPSGDCGNTKIIIDSVLYSSDINWKIKDESNQVVLSGFGYHDRQDVNLTECLSGGCYKFIIKDLFGDGFTSGSMKVNVNGQNKVYISGDFGTEKIVDFCVNQNSGFEVTTYSEDTDTDELLIYPNPAQSKVIILEANKELQGKYQIFTVEGKLISSGDLKGVETKVNIENFTSGMYHVKVSSNDGNVLTKKLVVQD